ncbi:hypothetical protein [Microtetraspora malaysiensis]
MARRKEHSFAPVLAPATAADLIGRSTQRANDAVNQLVAGAARTVLA